MCPPWPLAHSVNGRRSFDNEYAGLSDAKKIKKDKRKIKNDEYRQKKAEQKVHKAKNALEDAEKKAEAAAEAVGDVADLSPYTNQYLPRF